MDRVQVFARHFGHDASASGRGALPGLFPDATLATTKADPNIVIVGGGPCGLSVAIMLKDLLPKAKILVLEKRDGPPTRDSYVTLMAHTHRRLETMGVRRYLKDKSAPATRFVIANEVLNGHPNTVQIELKDEPIVPDHWEPLSYAKFTEVQRSCIHNETVSLCDLESALRERAREVGVDLRTNSPVTALVNQGKEVFGVQLSNGSLLAADLIVLAEGSRGTLAIRDLQLHYINVTHPEYHFRFDFAKNIGAGLYMGKLPSSVFSGPGPEPMLKTLYIGDCTPMDRATAGFLQVPKSVIPEHILTQAVSGTAFESASPEERQRGTAARNDALTGLEALIRERVRESLKVFEIPDVAVSRVYTERPIIIAERHVSCAAKGNVVLVGDCARHGTNYSGAGVQMCITMDVDRVRLLAQRIFIENERNCDKARAFADYDADMLAVSKRNCIANKKKWYADA